jgi:aryl-alcohol dehydrogenase-like predicted oxidoreductase
MLQRRTRRYDDLRGREPCRRGVVLRYSVAPIVGVTKPHHLDDALAAVDLALSDEDMARLEAPYRPHAPYGHS